MSDHQRHIQELSLVMRDLGALPPSESDFKAVLTRGKVIIGALVADQGILHAMLSNEDDTHTAYAQALKRNDIHPRAEGLLRQNSGGEKRHRAWIQQRLSQY